MQSLLEKKRPYWRISAKPSVAIINEMKQVYNGGLKRILDSMNTHKAAHGSSVMKILLRVLIIMPLLSLAGIVSLFVVLTSIASQIGF